MTQQELKVTINGVLISGSTNKEKIEILVNYINYHVAEERRKIIEVIQWELSEILIKERDINGHIDVGEYIKRLDKLKGE